MYSAAITVTVLAAFASLSSALKYDPDQVLWNLNQNQSATSGLDYWGEWQNHSKYRSTNITRLGPTLMTCSIQPFARKLALSFLYSYAGPICQWRSYER